MKKRSHWRYLLVFCLLTLFAPKIADAADITIGKYKYPSIIVIPITSIIVSMLILLILIFRVWKRKGGAVFENILDKLKVDVKRVKRIKKIEKEDKKKEESYLTEIKRLKRHLPTLESEKAFGILSNITKNFFKELLGLNYEFTYNELARELKNKGKRKELIDICQRLSEFKYSGSKISKEELGIFADELESFFRKEKRRKEEQELGVSKAFQHRKGFFGDLAYTIKAVKESRTEDARKKKIFELMKEEEDALKTDMEIAKNIYHKILASYYKLPPKEKKEVYERLNKFYNEINSMLFSSFYSEKSKKQLEYFASKLAQIKEETEKVSGREMHEKMHEKIAEKEAKPHEKKVLKVEPRTEIEDLKRLEKIEEEARERIKLIGESIVKQTIEKELMLPKEKHEVHKTIKPLPPLPQIKIPIKPAIMPKPKPLLLVSEHKRTIEIESPKITATPTHVVVPPKRIVERAVELKKERIAEKQTSPKHGKTKRLEWLDKEAGEIRERLEKLHQKHGYIG